MLLALVLTQPRSPARANQVDEVFAEPYARGKLTTAEYHERLEALSSSDASH